MVNQITKRQAKWLIAMLKAHISNIYNTKDSEMCHDIISKLRVLIQ